MRLSISRLPIDRTWSSTASASPVPSGRLSNAICGITPEDGDILAKSLGEALQLTNILRDVAEDAKRDHVYLPDELLVKNGYVSVTPDFGNRRSGYCIHMF